MCETGGTAALGGSGGTFASFPSALPLLTMRITPLWQQHCIRLQCALLCTDYWWFWEAEARSGSAWPASAGAAGAARRGTGGAPGVAPG